MILLLSFIAGFAFGWRRAKARGGQRGDCIQYGVAHGAAALLLVALGALILGFFGIRPF